MSLYSVYPCKSFAIKYSSDVQIKDYKNEIFSKMQDFLSLKIPYEELASNHIEFVYGEDNDIRESGMKFGDDEILWFDTPCIDEDEEKYLITKKTIPVVIEFLRPGFEVFSPEVKIGSKLTMNMLTPIFEGNIDGKSGLMELNEKWSLIQTTLRPFSIDFSIEEGILKDVEIWILHSF